MPPPRRPPAHLLLVCLFASFQQVSPKTFLFCGISLCSGERCCDGQCCRLFPGFEEETNNMFGLVFIIIGMMIGGMCLLAACKCIKDRAALHETEGVEPAQPQVPPAPRTTPPGSPSQQPQEDPPPYSEVALKPFLYQLPDIPPPSYSNVVMADPPATGVNHQATL
ncbi:leptin receptor gene-related protein [Platysternon megacephalum]|uniref:Leptin receptor gene-related protein n=1 Tax=Platysternon megacephalum TaxID=55544 RepID=A0A4D9EU14_9SAUR|nr:leptin receptor gene-related protein [Platysternon megacephalum]